MKRTTIKDIASALNIHHTTVSRALRNHPDVQFKTKQLVLEKARELNYQPNVLAQNLKTQRTNSIGVIVPEIRHHFFSAVISGIEEVAYEAGYIILVSQSNESYEREVVNTNALIANRVAGLLVSISQTSHRSDHFKLFLEQGGALVFFDRICTDLETNKVTVDDFQGGFDATEHLIKKGYSRIGHIGGSPDMSITEERYKGYCAALKKHNIPVQDEHVVFTGFHEADGREGMQKLLELSVKPDAVFAVNDPVALGAYDLLSERKMNIPDDMAMVGFSNNPISAVVCPRLTTINQPAYEMGKRAALLLIEQINNGETDFRHEVLATELIERDST